MARKTQPLGLRQAIAAILCLLALTATAQDDDLEYKADFGAGLGTCFYMGDANSVPFAHMSIMTGLTARRILNQRMAVKANLAYGNVRGNSDGCFIPTDANSQTPEGGIPTSVSFSRSVLDLGAQFEMNFWGFGMGKSYKGDKRCTPYILAGLGMTLAVGGGASASPALNIPVGLGVKYKVKPRMNIGAEWTFRFTTTDKLDVSGKMSQLNMPYGINSPGFSFKNKDCYSFLMFFITYDMCPKLRKCNN